MLFRRAPRTRSFAICGMPRSGTAFLAGLLASTRRVGLAREYFNPEVLPDEARADLRAFVARTLAETTVAGVFGMKFVAEQLWGFLELLRMPPGNARLSDRRLLEQMFPRPRYVWVERRDVVAEAVSWWKAHETREWWRAVDSAPSPVASDALFDAGEIDRLVGELVRGNERWEGWFAEHGIEPFRVVYEELEAEPEQVTRRVLSFLGVELTPDLTVEPLSARQADALNAKWIARYRALGSRRESVDLS